MKHASPYDPKIHTRQRLLDQLEQDMRHEHGPLLIGSLGRAAVLRSEREFHVRGETLVKDRRGRARDIDLFLPRGGSVTIPARPFPVDTTAVTAHDQRVVFENGDYWLVDDLLGFAVPVDADVFTPHPARLFGELDVTTFSVRTHWALLFVIFEDPSKYALARQLLQSHIAENSEKGIAELYQPFTDFHQRRRKSVLNQMRRIYRRGLPFEIRSKLQPWVSEWKSMFSCRNTVC